MLNATKTDEKRKDSLRTLLRRERQDALVRVQILRRQQEEDVTPPPTDEFEVARSLADVETHAALIDRVEKRLKAVDEAMERLQAGEYGVCADCGEKIKLARLRAVPLAIYCIDCQQKRNRLMHLGAGEISRSVRRRWTIPEEVDESFEAGDIAHTPEEEVMVHADSPFGPEEGEAISSDFAGGRRRRRGRPRRQEAAHV
ncbi:MAG TPA: TraR/DksA C4-type zinc finger protein [Candidatus Binataceae bacterium]|nr:TraR/DksA C4-type zinc finger protein [Candidatus Binataceae bacterium]